MPTGVDILASPSARIYMAEIMNRLASTLAAIAVLFIQNPAFAGGPPNDPAKTAEQFYAGYLVLVNAEKDTMSWVNKSHFATRNFKRWYAKQMSSESVEADPVLEAQDTPTTPFKAIKTMIQGTAATVILRAKYSNETQKLTVHMVQMNGVWQMDAVDSAK